MKKHILAGAALFAAISGNAQDAATVSDLQKQIKELQREVQTLKEGAPRDAEADAVMGERLFKSKGLTIGFYGESKYRFPETGKNSFDAHRYVLSPSYQINDWLVFNSELELEHGGVDDSTSRGSRFDGELELEQFYVDILLNEHFNIRSLGIDLVPVGRINKYHEPTLFYSTERPELYREIIPSTWMEPSLGFFGKITESLNYQVMISTGLEDFSSSAAGEGFTAGNGIRNARPRLRGGNENGLAYSGRLNYTGIPGLDASTSFYVTEVRGIDETRSMVGLWDIEALYRIPNTGFEFRGEFAYWRLGDPENFLANNNSSTTDNIGDAMYGWYVEAAYHFWPEAWRDGKGKSMDLVPFVRYSDIVTQSGLRSGTEIDDGSANKDFLTVGLSYFLNENFVVKADYRRNLNGGKPTRTQSANQDYFQIGAGVFF